MSTQRELETQRRDRMTAAARSVEELAASGKITDPQALAALHDEATRMYGFADKAGNALSEA